VLHQFLTCAWKDLKIFFKDPMAVVFMFLLPFLFIVMMGYALRGLFEPGKDPIRILAVNQDRGDQGATIIRQLEERGALRVETAWEGQPLTRETAEKLIIEGKRSLALVFPPDFSEALEGAPGAAPHRTKVLLIVDPATPDQVVGPVAGTLQGLMERSAYTAMMPRGLDYLFAQLAPQVPPEQREVFKARAQEALSGGLFGGGEPVVTLERTAPPGMRVKRFPNVYQQNVPGFTTYGVFWVVTLLAHSVLREKRDGTFRRLLVAPVSRTVILAGKMVPYYLINLMQIAILFGTSSLLFALHLGHSPLGLVVVSLAVAAAATGLGALVAALVRTEAQATGLTVLLLLTMSALGGSFVPRFIMPEWLQTLGLITPHAWAIDAYQDLLVRGYGLREIWPKVGVLTAFSVAFFGVGVWRFRFQ
jgi:ABC-2 type transport system permease protein